MTSSLIASIVLLGIGYFIGSYRVRSYIAQNAGEAAVRGTLMQHLHPTNYHLLNHVTLQTEDGTTQIDHVLVSRYGIFVIETKNYKGWIFADLKSPSWMQVIFGRKYKFQNPVHQNYKHVRAIQGILDFIDPEHIKSLVVFTGSATFKTKRPEGVVMLEELLPFISKYDTPILTENRRQFCVGRLECLRLAISHQTDIQHLANLEKRFR